MKVNPAEYLFNSLYEFSSVNLQTGEGLDGEVPAHIGDSIHIANSFSKLNGNNELEIISDDGNESSFGNETWNFDTPGFATCTENFGVDCFFGTLADVVFGESKTGRISISEFDAAIKNHMQNWEYRTANS